MEKRNEWWLNFDGVGGKQIFDWLRAASLHLDWKIENLD
jgi:hypothetical protein